MRRLKVRKPVSALPNQPRARRQALTRWIYLVSVAALALWLVDEFVGGLLFLRSEGMVVGEPAFVATEFPVTVRDVRVREGDRLEAGSVVALVSSQKVAESIARLTAEVAGMEARRSALRIRVQTVDALIAVAEDRQVVTEDARKEVEKLWQRGYLPIDRRIAAVESDFRGRQDLESLRAEQRTAKTELETLSAAVADAETALGDLQRLYDNGRLRMPIDGIVADVLARKGAVVPVGEPVIAVYGDERFVLAYIPTGALYGVAPGDRVHITVGLQEFEGVVARTEPIAAALPREFQRAFRPVERQQVIRVSFAHEDEAPPLFTKVGLHEPGTLRISLKEIWLGLKWAFGHAVAWST